jgi:hypothetical protein
MCILPIKNPVKGYLFSTEMFSYYHVSRGETHTENEGYSNDCIRLLHQILRSKEQLNLLAINVMCVPVRFSDM